MIRDVSVSHGVSARSIWGYNIPLAIPSVWLPFGACVALSVWPLIYESDGAVQGALMM